jgi:hypothetical protein
LPATGSADDVVNALSINIYSNPASELYSTEFLTGAAEQVKYVYSMLGGAILDIELQPLNVYNCYENAVLEYSYLVNLHQAKNSLSQVLGSATGTFDHNGNIVSGSALSGKHYELKFPKYNLSYLKRVSDGFSAQVGIGNGIRMYSASFDVITDVQDYDLQNILYQQSLTASCDFYGKLSGSSNISISKVYYKTNAAGWRFFGYYGGIQATGNATTYGQYADDSSFQVIPVWQNKLQAMAFEDAIFTRNSHYSFEIINNRLRIFPAPVSSYQTKFWFNFSIDVGPYDESDARGLDSMNGVNNVNTLPFENILYGSINSMGKNWIRRYALSCAKGVLGQVRSKFDQVPIPDDHVTLNGVALIEQSEKEMEALREELKTVLDTMSYSELAKRDAEIADSALSTLQKVPSLIYIG